ncbi:RNA polymerase sigma factor RpoD/SigA [bacterium]|nr:RNA polymerase sigma factor RpoD/SigA [candidate division CSSED10-310 bacterium]
MRTDKPMEDQNSLSKYLQEINKYRMFDKEEEAEIARRIQEGDESAIQELVKANLRFVVSIAKKYLGSGMPLEDLINEGTIGLIEAAKRFNPERGVKFITYAVWWVRQAILYAISAKSGIVKLPQSQANLLSSINKRIQTLTQELGHEPTITELSDSMGIPENEIENLLRTTRASLPIEPHSDNEDESLKFIDLMDYETVSAEDQVMEDAFADEVELLMACLDDRETEILKMHYGFDGKPKTLQEIGNKYGLTRERIRKIEQRAIQKLKRVASRRKLKDYLS